MVNGFDVFDSLVVTQVFGIVLILLQTGKLHAFGARVIRTVFDTVAPDS